MQRGTPWRPTRGLWLLLRAVLLLAVGVLFGAVIQAQTSPDAACAGCHRAIYDRYEKTAMARGSGPAQEGLLTGGFTHEASGIRYSVERQKDGQAVLRYARAQEPALQGSKPLAYYIGSGKRGRTYLFETDGYWFQSPINFYTRSSTWEMAPGYASARGLPMDLRVDEGCLFCHGSGVRPSQAGSTNHFGARPFAEGGITCDRCHGDAAAHIASGGKSAVLNPAKLAPERRDAICQQCHLEGEVSVLHAGTRASDFHPGDRLFDKVSYFVHAQGDNLGVRAVSQVEALAQSVCKQKSGDAMTCTTCHDPHGTVAPAEKVAWYRARCLTCHTDAKFVARHHPDKPDCAGCHMPTNATTDIAHEQASDHRILKVPAATDMPMDEASSRLVAVLESRHDAREMGLAYASFARKGDLFSLGESVRLLQTAERQMPDDASVAFALAGLYETQGDSERADALYLRAYKLDAGYPGAEQAVGNVAVRSGKKAKAVELWKDAVDHDRVNVALARRLATAQCEQGSVREAIATLEGAMHFSPGSVDLAGTLRRWQTGAQSDCVIH